MKKLSFFGRIFLIISLISSCSHSTKIRQTSSDNEIPDSFILYQKDKKYLLTKRPYIIIQKEGDQIVYTLCKKFLFKENYAYLASNCKVENEISINLEEIQRSQKKYDKLIEKVTRNLITPKIHQRQHPEEIEKLKDRLPKIVTRINKHIYSIFASGALMIISVGLKAEYPVAYYPFALSSIIFMGSINAIWRLTDYSIKVEGKINKYKEKEELKKSMIKDLSQNLSTENLKKQINNRIIAVDLFGLDLERDFIEIFVYLKNVFNEK